MSDWKSIQTAPKNGSRFLGFSDLGVEVFSWNDQKYNRKPMPYWSSAGSLGVAWDRMHQPTHWMPLPEPPEDKR